MFEEITLMEDRLLSNGFNPNESLSCKRYALRHAGHSYTFNEHVGAMVLSLLGANRPWITIENNFDNLSELFHGYDATYICNTDPQVFIDGISKLGCGNRAIVRQMNGLAYNVDIMHTIEDVSGISIDKVVTYDTPRHVADVLLTDRYRFKNMQRALTHQYLRNVGIDLFKPDVHITRILTRLGYVPYEDCSADLYFTVFEKMSEELNKPITYINEVIWMYGATGYAEICKEPPRCSCCDIKICASRKGRW